MIKPFIGHENRSLAKSKKKKKLQGGTLRNFQNSEYFVLFLDTKILNKSTVRFVLWWNSLNKFFIFPFWVGICMGGTLKTQSFVISSIKLTLKYKIAEQKVLSDLFYGEIRWTKLNRIVICPISHVKRS
jgi:hypothetical protein